MKIMDMVTHQSFHKEQISDHQSNLQLYVRHLDLHVGTLQTTYRETSLASLSPALLMAVTLNW